MEVAGRVFRSSAIVKRHDYTGIESEDGYHIQIGCPLNIPKTRENGFSEEVISMIGLQGLRVLESALLLKQWTALCTNSLYSFCFDPLDTHLADPR
jgi:hypothetical protein